MAEHSYTVHTLYAVLGTPTLGVTPAQSAPRVGCETERIGVHHRRHSKPDAGSRSARVWQGLVLRLFQLLLCGIRTCGMEIAVALTCP